MMYARSTMVMAGRDLQEGVGFIRDGVWPALQAMEGCVGFSLLVEPERGRMIATSSWNSLDAMRGSDSAVAPLRVRAQELMAAEPPQVEEWEIAVMHRDHHTSDGTCVRATWTRVPLETVDQAIQFYKFVLLPELEQLDGFCSASLMVDKATGRGVSSVAFDTMEAMEATRYRADGVRERSRHEAGVEILEVAEFELALAHLHLPELV